MKLLRAMGTEELIKFLNNEPLISKKKHKGLTDSFGFCFANGDSIYENMEHLSGIVDDTVVLIGVLKDKPKQVFTKGYGIYASHIGIPKDAMEALTSTLDLVAQIADREKRKENQIKVDEWSTTQYSKEDFESWELYVKCEPSNATLDKLGFNDFQKDLAKKLNSTQWLQSKLVGKGGR